MSKHTAGEERHRYCLEENMEEACGVGWELEGYNIYNSWDYQGMFSVLGLGDLATCTSLGFWIAVDQWLLCATHFPLFECKCLQWLFYIIIIFGKWGRLTCPSIHRSLDPEEVHLRGHIQWTTSKETYLIWTWFRCWGPGLWPSAAMSETSWGGRWAVSVLCMWEGCEWLWSEGGLW